MLSPLKIRENLRHWLAKTYSLTSDDVLIDELGFVNKSKERNVDIAFRADLALANGRLVAYEIKSANDTLKRWAAQCSGYLNVFDEVWLCIHGAHVEKALSETPKIVGLLALDDFGNFAVLRKASPNGSVVAYDLTGLLWRSELDELAARFDIGVKRKDTKPLVRAAVSQGVGLEQIREFVLDRLKVRKGAV